MQSQIRSEKRGLTFGRLTQAARLPGGSVVQAEKPAPKPSARSLTLPEMLLLVLAVSVCIYPAFAPFGSSRPARITLGAATMAAPPVVPAR